MGSAEFTEWLAYYMEFPERLAFVEAEGEALKADYRMAISSASIINNMRALWSGKRNPKKVKPAELLPDWQKRRGPRKRDSFEELKTKREALRAIFGLKNTGKSQ